MKDDKYNPRIPVRSLPGIQRDWKYPDLPFRRSLTIYPDHVPRATTVSPNNPYYAYHLWMMQNFLYDLDFAAPTQRMIDLMDQLVGCHVCIRVNLHTLVVYYRDWPDEAVIRLSVQDTSIITSLRSSIQEQVRLPSVTSRMSTVTRSLVSRIV